MRDLGGEGLAGGSKKALLSNFAAALHWGAGVLRGRGEPDLADDMAALAARMDERAGTVTDSEKVVPLRP